MRRIDPWTSMRPVWYKNSVTMSVRIRLNARHVVIRKLLGGWNRY